MVNSDITRVDHPHRWVLNPYNHAYIHQLLVMG